MARRQAITSSATDPNRSEGWGAVAFSKTGPMASAPLTPTSRGGMASTNFTRPISDTLEPAKGARPQSASQATTARAY